MYPRAHSGKPGGTFTWRGTRPPRRVRHTGLTSPARSTRPRPGPPGDGPRGRRPEDAGVRGFELPRSLACPAAGDGNGDPAWPRWIAGLPGIVDDLARRWSLRVGRPFQPGGSASWVAPARTSGGERVVLKVGF